MGAPWHGVDVRRNERHLQTLKTGKHRLRPERGDGMVCKKARKVPYLGCDVDIEVGAVLDDGVADEGNINSKDGRGECIQMDAESRSARD